jgi:hypothetical protein
MHILLNSPPKLLTIEHIKKSHAKAWLFFLYYLKLIFIGKRYVFIGKIIGIPVCHGGYFVLQGEISAVVSPSESLHCYLKVFLEVYGIGDMPAVHIEEPLRTVDRICGAYLVKTRIGSTVFTVSANVKVAGAAEIVLCARAANCGEVLIAVYKEFNFAFTPPSVGFNAPMEICSNIVAVALDIIKNKVVLLIGKGINPPAIISYKLFAAAFCTSARR